MNSERLRDFRQAVREQGPERGGRPPTEDEVQSRTQALGQERRVTVRDVTVETSDVDGLPGGLGHTQAGVAIVDTVQIRSRVYTVRGSARTRTLLWSLEEPFDLQFSLRLSVTMRPSIETHAPSLPSEPSVSRGM